MLIYKPEDFISYPNNYHIFYCAESRYVHMHAHEFYELVYVYEGSGNHHTPDGVSALNVGDYILISPGIEHCITSVANDNLPRIRIYNCLFTKEYFENAIQKLLKADYMKNTELHSLFETSTMFYLQLSDRKYPTVKNYIQAMKSEYDFMDGCIDDVIKNNLENLLIETSRILDIKHGRKTMSVTKNIELENLISYMKANLDLPLTLNSLADQIHLSTGHLSRYFKKCTGKNISVYLIELRMTKAKELLEHSNYPINEICYLCGYQSVSNFRKYFNKYVGISPSEYRKSKL